jgi:3-oxoacyl-[acyl-carrier protein] reductase
VVTTGTLDALRGSDRVPLRDGAALVTGGSRGIGAAVAAALAADGWRVAVNYRSGEAEARGIADAIEAAGGTAVALGGDVAAPDTADRLLAEVEERLGPVHVLVNNAGVRADGLAVQLEDDEWDRVIDTNLSAAFRLTRRAMKGMIRRRHGRVVNIASVVGPKANAGQANYAASKAGLIGMTRTIAVEVARRGVTVNAVAPGFIETDMTEDLPPALLDAVPARRAGRPEDVAACVRFLASDEAAYITGTTLVVDGGLSA